LLILGRDSASGLALEINTWRALAYAAKIGGVAGVIPQRDLHFPRRHDTCERDVGMNAELERLAARRVRSETLWERFSEQGNGSLYRRKCHVHVLSVFLFSRALMLALVEAHTHRRRGSRKEDDMKEDQTFKIVAESGGFVVHDERGKPVSMAFQDRAQAEAFCAKAERDQEQRQAERP
jgi:hypothetical protein